MLDELWKKYTLEGNHYFSNKEFCCANTNYRIALYQAERLLQQSFEIDKNIPIINILIISYRNLFTLYEDTRNIEQLKKYLNYSCYALVGILKSSEFPSVLQESCKTEIYRLYHSISDYCQRFPEIQLDATLLLKEICSSLINHELVHQEKGN